MKIIFASFQAISILEGGVKTQILALKNELEKLGVEVELFDSWQNYSIRQIDFWHLFCAHIGTYHLVRTLSNLGAKMVLTPVFFRHRSPYFIKNILTLSKIVSKFSGFWSEYQLINEICQLANIIVPNTKKERDLIQQSFGISPKKFQILPNGVDERFYNADPNLFIKQYGINNFILYVGHIGWGRKNLLSLLKVCQQIDHPLVLIGKVLENDYAQKCLAIIKSRPHTILIPGLNHNDPLLASAYSACDTFVLPSYYETPGLSALEAGLAGAKVVITKIGGTEEYFKDYAQYINPFSLDSLRQGLVKALEQKKRPELKEHIRSNYLWKVVAENLVEIYRKK
ncbi:MAG: glycosyltransferase family 4 protein [candidate division WOR-3 bacterium]|nr:glycosyltransferase family 4 protein [candidate division WOR-3 bacterium]